MAEAVGFVRRYVHRTPEIAVVLGSGLGAVIDAARDMVSLSSAEIPGYPRSTVEGHPGRLIFGRLAGREVVFVQGRVHVYEGHAAVRTAFPIRLVHALGAHSVVVTNAAGGINPALTPGTLMFITDHVDFSFAGPTRGSERAGPLHVPRIGTPYDPEWRIRVEEDAIEMGIPACRGVYLWTAGPSYESKAEIRAFRRFGADAVGMSTVPETMQAWALGMRVLGISAITNAAAGRSPVPLRHEEVLALGRRMLNALGRIIEAAVQEAPP